MKHSVAVALVGGSLIAGVGVVEVPVAGAGSKCVPLNGTNLVQSRWHNPGIGMKIRTTETYSYRDGQVVWQFESNGGVKIANQWQLGGEYVSPFSIAGATPADPGETVTITSPQYISTVTVCKK